MPLISSCLPGGFSAWGNVSQVEAAANRLVPAQGKGLDVGFDDLLVVGAASGEALDHELLKIFVGHVDQPGYGSDDDHIGCPVVAGGAGQLLDGHSEAAAVVLQLELVRVVDNHAAVPDFGYVVVVSLLVEGNQHVQVVPRAEDGRCGNPRLSPGRTAKDLRGKCREGLDVVASLGGRLGQGFGGSYNALAPLSGESYY